MARQNKVRAYCFTINNPDHMDLGDCLQLYDTLGQYMILGFEIGDTGTEHIQGYVYFRNAQYFNTVRGVLVRANISVAKGTPQENYDYCSKDSLYVEYGELPTKGKATWDKIELAMLRPKENPHLYNQYRKTFIDVMAGEVCLPKPRHLCYYPMSEKYDLMTEFYAKHETVCTNETLYNGESIVLVDATSIFSSVDDNHREWSHGFPPLIKYGYQVRRFDPDLIVYLIDDDNKYIKNLFSNYRELNAVQKE